MQKYPHMLDQTDSRILAILQRNANLTAQELSDQLNLSASQIGRRRQRLETEGYIDGYSARINPVKLELSVQAFVQVHLSTHGPDQSSSFSRLIDTQPAITGAWTMTGDADYLLRLYCKDLSALNALIHEILLPHPAVARVHSQIVMDQLKRDGPLPT
jgi:DNA-binding Lrp family transcriptional regulator